MASTVTVTHPESRLRATLVTIILVASALAAAEAGLGYRLANSTLLLLALGTGVFAILMIYPLVLNHRKQHALAVVVACLAIFGIQMVYIIGFPRAYPAVTVAAMVVVALALPFVRGKPLLGLVAGSGIIAAAAIVRGVLAPPSSSIPTSADPIILIGSGVASVAVAMVLLWRFAQDMTEELHQTTAARNELAHAHGQLQELDRLKTGFINSAAHELNTPLTPVLLQLKVLENRLGAGQDNLRQSVRVVERNMHRIADLVHDMLDVARLQSGRAPTRAEPTDLAVLLREAVDDYAAIAEDGGVQVSLAADSPATAIVDRRHVAQIVSNLLSNAVRLTPRGGQVHVGLRRDAAEWIVTVTDTGIGMTPDQQARLFQPFGRVHDEQPSGSGSGIGLFISQNLAKVMGGRLEATSPGPGRGSTFALHLPVTTGVVAFQEKPGQAAPPFATFK